MHACIRSFVHACIHSYAGRAGGRVASGSGPAPHPRLPRGHPRPRHPRPPDPHERHPPRLHLPCEGGARGGARAHDR
eukprot:8765851-Pyramimonas_sp.AAC.1